MCKSLLQFNKILHNKNPNYFPPISQKIFLLSSTWKKKSDRSKLNDSFICMTYLKCFLKKLVCSSPDEDTKTKIKTRTKKKEKGGEGEISWEERNRINGSLIIRKAVQLSATLLQYSRRCIQWILKRKLSQTTLKKFFCFFLVTHLVTNTIPFFFFFLVCLLKKTKVKIW